MKQIPTSFMVSEALMISKGKEMKHRKYGTLILLHLLLALYSFGAILGKLAALCDFLSLRFVLFYGGVILILGVYALFWQQIIKRLPLTVAYANRAVTVVWGIIWGYLFFHETVSAQKVIGAAVVMAGIVLYAGADHEADPGTEEVQHDGY